MNEDFAIFIMVHGRPDKDWTLRTLRRCGYTGPIFLVADNLDETMPEYKKKYGKMVLVFDKNEAKEKYDSGDNTGDLRSTLYVANTIFDLAEEQGFKYFSIMCDDYTDFGYVFDEQLEYKYTATKRMDDVLRGFLDFYKNTPTSTIAFAQGGDFVGGKKGSNAEPKLLRKAMNSFICSTDRRFEFIGRLNEDVTTYVNLGARGLLFFTNTMFRLSQKPSQSEASGLTDVYLDYGTYTKSFFSVMYNPSSVKISELGSSYKRIHHEVSWNNCAVKILSEKHKL